jgi:hypothetical protein
MAFNFDQIKGLFNTIKEKGSEVAGAAAGKTKDAARLAKLTMDLNTEKGSLEKAFLELGKTFYEESKDSAEGLAAQLCAEIGAIKGRLESIQSEMDELKDSFKPVEEPDFDEVVSAEEPCECCEEETCEGCENEKKDEPECCCDDGEKKEDAECCCGDGEKKEDAECCCDDGEKKEDAECCCDDGEKKEDDITVEITEEPAE